MPEHNWIAYEQALKANPVLAKMAISGIVYFIGDWIAQVSLSLFLSLFHPFLFLLATNMLLLTALIHLTKFSVL